MSAADWKPYDVPGLAELLAEQPTDSGSHAMAWQQAYETLTDQRQRIEAARAALTEAWPATPGSAAGSFFDQVDALTQAMSATAESAVDAHSALTGIVTAVDGATTKVDTLHQSWRQNQATIGDVVPTDDWTQPLNDQAHTVMAQADAAIAEHATQLAPPAPYKPPIAIETYTPIESPTGGAARGTVNPSGHTGESSNATRTDRRALPVGSAASSSTGSESQATSASDRVVLAGRAGAPSEFAFSPSAAGHIAAPGAVVQPLQPVDIGLKEIGTGGPGAFNNDRISTSHGVAEQRSNAADGWRGGTDGVLGSQRQAQVRADNTASSRATSNAVAIDGTNQEFAGRSAVAGSVDRGGDYAGPEGILSPGTSFAGSPAPSRRRRSMESLRWPMPVGVPAIIEAVEVIEVEHHPGSGVIGIDL